MCADNKLHVEQTFSIPLMNRPFRYIISREINILLLKSKLGFLFV